MTTRTYTTRNAADAAARRELRSIHGKQYQPKAKVDFHTYRALYSLDWTFEIINEAAHRASVE